MAKKAKRNGYYRLDKVLEHDAQYNILIGGRDAGKSYACKEYVILNAMQGKGEFVLLRRYAMDVTPSKVVRYFGNMSIEGLTGGKYNEVFARGGYIYLRWYDYTNNCVDKTITPLIVGHYGALAQAEHLKSDGSFENVTSIIFEEFITKGLYLSKTEPDDLLQLVSTVCRDNEIKVFMVGNTISRICPYIQGFGLTNVMRMAQDTIDDYYKDVTDKNDNVIDTVKIAVENCKDFDIQSKMFFGSKQKSINNGCWETDDEPRLLDRKRKYRIRYRMFLQDLGFSFAIELLEHAEERNRFVIFIYPCTPKHKNARILSTDYAETWNVTPFLNMNNKAELLIGRCYEFGKVAYSDNLTGADFKSILLNNDKLFKGAHW